MSLDIIRLLQRLAGCLIHGMMQLMLLCVILSLKTSVGMERSQRKCATLWRVIHPSFGATHIRPPLPVSSMTFKDNHKTDWTNFIIFIHAVAAREQICRIMCLDVIIHIDTAHVCRDWIIWPLSCLMLMSIDMLSSLTLPFTVLSWARIQIGIISNRRQQILWTEQPLLLAPDLKCIMSKPATPKLP